MRYSADVKMFLFARWVATCYADEHMDTTGKSQHDKGYNPHEAMSVLNLEKGAWWREQLEHFNKIVWPSYVENGSADNAAVFLSINLKKSK